MAQALSKTLKLLSSKTGIEPNIILEIEGLSKIFGAQSIFKQGLFDEDHEFDDGLFFDTPILDPDSRDYISLKKTTKNISQQILIDKGSSSSVTRMNIELVDINGEITELVQFGNEIPDLLGARARVYLNFVGGSHPEDSLRVFTGYIDEYNAEAGVLLLGISSSENLKRQSTFTQAQTDTTSAIDDVVTNIPTSSTSGFYATQDAVTSYIRIEDEIMQITTINAGSFDVVRGSLGTAAVSHDNNTEVISFYRMQGSPVDLALKLMLSDEGNTFSIDSKIDLENFAYISTTSTIQNALKFSNLDVQRDTNLQVGDLIKTTGAANAANNGTFTITGFDTIDDGSIILVDGANFVVEIDTAALITFQSQYNTLATGLGMLPDEVDVVQHERMNTLFSSGFSTYDIYMRETIEDAKSFIDSELYRPMGLYSIIRSSRASVNMTAPPLTVDVTPILDNDIIQNPDKLSIKRNSHKYFYNEFVFKYNQANPLEDRLFSGNILINNESKTRIRAGNQQFLIEASGLRRSPATVQNIERIQNRLSDRYRFAAGTIKGIELLYKDGFNLEVGDVVRYNSSDSQLPNLEDGTRVLTPKLYEIVNRNFSFNKSIKIDLLETSFLINTRVGVFSPSSFLKAGSSTTVLPLKLSFDTGEYDSDTEKWQDFIGEKIRVRTEDYTTFDEITTITGLSTTIPDAINITALSSAPPEDAIVEIVTYDDTSALNEEDYKLRFTYNGAQTEIDVVTDASNFTVLDATNLFIGATVQIHSDDYTRDSFNETTEFTILNLVGSAVALSSALPFTPVSGDKIEQTLFEDGGFGYTYY